MVLYTTALILTTKAAALGGLETLRAFFSLENLGLTSKGCKLLTSGSCRVRVKRPTAGMPDPSSWYSAILQKSYPVVEHRRSARRAQNEANDEEALDTRAASCEEQLCSFILTLTTDRFDDSRIETRRLVEPPKGSVPGAEVGLTIKVHGPDSSLYASHPPDVTAVSTLSPTTLVSRPLHFSAKCSKRSNQRRGIFECIS